MEDNTIMSVVTQYWFDDVFNHVCSKSRLVDRRFVLGREDYSIDVCFSLVIITDRDLSFSIRKKIVQKIRLSDRSELFCETMSEMDREWKIA